MSIRNILSRNLNCKRSCGPMDKALVFGSINCRFESCYDHQDLPLRFRRKGRTILITSLRFYDIGWHYHGFLINIFNFSRYFPRYMIYLNLILLYSHIKWQNVESFHNIRVLSVIKRNTGFKPKPIWRWPPYINSFRKILNLAGHIECYKLD